MAKEKAKAPAKAAPDEQLVEKPREPMFSKAGMIVFAGSLLLCAVVVFAVGSFIFGGDPAPAGNGDGDGAATTSKIDADSIEILKITGITAQVPMHGGGQKKVRFSLNIQFDGNPEERTRSMEWVKQKDREAMLTQMANEVMASYDFEVIRDNTFARTFERAFRDRFNNQVAGHRIREAKIYNQDW